MAGDVKVNRPVARFDRISAEQALELHRRATIHELGRMAFEACCGLHPEPYRTYVVDRNINYSNICTSGCTFCNFKVPPGDPKAYVLSRDELGRRIHQLIEIGGTQILMQGGVVPTEILTLEWYLDLLRFIKTNWPRIHVHAFSPPEIFALHRRTGTPLGDLLARLRDAGLDTIPGGGAEILVDRVRRRISPRKCSADQWLDVMRAAHRLGMRTTATMMFGHVETIPERIEHFARIRDLQDETGGFTAFILWPFQPDNTPLGHLARASSTSMRPAPAGPPAAGQDDRAAFDGPLPVGYSSRATRHSSLALAGAHEYLKMLALARLFLDNVANLQASWVTMGPKIGQLALFFGANDMGSVMMEENVVRSAGTAYRLDEAAIRRLIADAGWQPRKRDGYYNLLE